jgi:N-acetylglutamate synthase-like GNAT family acetyltransferase
MPATPTKIRRRRRSGELTVEQTHDPALISAMLHRAVVTVPVIDQSVECFLIAYLGDIPVGIAGLVTEVDAALIGVFFVVENMRGHGIGARLIPALRLAAHTRGARTLYAVVPSKSVDYFARFGFAETTLAEPIKMFGHALMRQQIQFANLQECRAVRIDLSRDGLVER